MSTFEVFEQCLRDALAHLYDPAYRPPELLCQVLGLEPRPGIEAVQYAIIRAMEALKPAPIVPATARSKRIYDLLAYRYVQNLTQEETAGRLGITSRHLRREQPEAVHVLALHLWEQRRADALPAEEIAQTTGVSSPAAMPPDARLPDWLGQVRQELLALQKSAPGAVAPVEETMQRALDVAIALTARHGIGLQVEHVQPKTVAAIHPTVLRQILIAAIGQLSQHMSSGEIRLGAEREAKHIKITITGQPASIVPVTDAYVMREIVAAQGGSVEVGLANSDRVSFWVKLPAVDRAVLVVDDNADLVHVYRRYVTGTKYYIVHVAQGQRVLETAEALSPDVIVLDVMLPDVDGWELLANLHQHPATRSIPVVVCSVLSEEDLALALGAALYLSKPVHRDEFLRALDEAFTQASTAARTAPAHSAATS